LDLKSRRFAGKRITRILAKAADGNLNSKRNIDDDDDEDEENKRNQEDRYKYQYESLSRSYLENPFLRLEVKKSHIHGYGLYSKTNFVKDDMIVEYIGIYQSISI
jgi:hypothetical protein